MNIEQSLFEGERLRLAALDPEPDAVIEARWSNDAGYLRMLSLEPARPVTAAQVKKRYEAMEKEIDEKQNQFYFSIRLKDDDRMIGFARLNPIDHAHAWGRVEIGIGDEHARGQGYGREALALLVRFAFVEANLECLTAMFPEYNQPAARLFAAAGFQEQVRRRQAVQRDGRRWDVLHWGLLRDEWLHYSGEVFS